MNVQLIELYWQLGRLITEKRQASSWDDAAFDKVAKELTRELGGLKFLWHNPYGMNQFVRR